VQIKANCNFEENNVNILTLNGDIKANCNAYPLRNLTVEIEDALLKLNGHFSILANICETLKDFTSFADTALLEIRHHASTRWLSLLPCFGSGSILHT